MAKHTTTTTSGTTGTHSKDNKGALALTAFLVPLHILVFTALLIMCAIVFDNYAEGGGATSMLTSPAALMTLIFSFLAGAVGLATMIMALVHGGSRTESAKHSTLAANLVTFALVALAFGFACKTIAQRLFRGEGDIGNLMIAICAFDIFLGLGMLLYLAHLGMFKKHDDHHTATYNTDRTYTTNTNNDRTYTTNSNHPGCINDTHHTGKDFVAGHEQQRAMHA